MLGAGVTPLRNEQLFAFTIIYVTIIIIIIIIVAVVFCHVPFLKMCIRSLHASTLPSASMTPGRVSRAAARAGELTAATLLCGRTSAGWSPAEWPSGPDVRRGRPFSSITAPQRG